ncbi:MAG: diguanylate cyclase [Oscillospiraceae bacterium]
MKNKTLLRTNLLVCLIIIIGFVITSVISYRSNAGMFRTDMEQVANLTSEGIYTDIATIFSQPVNVSLTMANDSLLKSFLADEDNKLTDEKYLGEMKQYLDTYRKKYSYDSVFLVSTNTNRYYHFNGVDRTLIKGDPENVWYYDFLQSDDEYSLNVDNDETTDDNIITVFVNCKIKSADGTVLGVVGVGLQVHSLQSLLKIYEEEYGVKAFLVDNTGVIEISSQNTGYEKINLFDSANYADQKDSILSNKGTRETFWYSNGSRSGYIVTRYEPNLRWHLVIENDTSEMYHRLKAQLLRNILIIIIIIISVLVTISLVIRKYNSRIIKLTTSQELEYQRLLNNTTAELYESIFEFDITHNKAGGEKTKQYFESLGLSGDAQYDKALAVVAKKQIKSEYIDDYLNIFSQKNVLEAFHNGINNLTYDFMISPNGTADYRWMRISARIFFWNSDKSVRMITYRENIDAEKKRELMLLDGIQRDAMTGLFNKRTTEQMIETALQTEIDTHASHALLVFDIDNFKTVNDTMGHAFGDHVIIELAAEIKTQFREYDITGRVGGDEFAVLMKNIESEDALHKKLDRICARLSNKDLGEGEIFHTSCSIGVAVFPQHGTRYSELFEKADQALYYSKGHGKNSFSIFGQNTDSQAFHVNQRDMEVLMTAATDGLAKFACTNPMTLLYFNEKCVKLTGMSVKTLSEKGFDPTVPIHPDDVAGLINTLTAASKSRSLFSTQFRMRHKDGYYFPVKMQGIFIKELYENHYPIFYAMYTILQTPDESNEGQETTD